MTALGKFLLFFSSWVPAYVMVTVLVWGATLKTLIVSLILIVVCCGVYFFVEWLMLQRSIRSLKVDSISRRDENILMYVIAYLPPFFSVNYDNVGHLTALALFYIFFSMTYVKLGLYYLNPIIIFRSFRAYTLVSESGTEYVALISGTPPRHGETVHYRGRDNVLLIRDR